jgi:hypothetical protein
VVELRDGETYARLYLYVAADLPSSLRVDLSHALLGVWLHLRPCSVTIYVGVSRQGGP